MCIGTLCLTSQEAQAAIIAALIGLVGGLLAVAAAVVVGLRQSQIMKSQTDIAKRMFELEEVRLKSELYDRRMEVYKAVRDMLSVAALTGKIPGIDANSEGDLVSLDVFQRFQDGLSAAQFLFDQKTRSKLDELYKLMNELSEVTDLIRQGSRGLNAVELTEARKRKSNLRGEVVEAFTGLSKLFPDLDLTVRKTTRPA